jgi:quercetin dioxygenase-like cupin family protein
MNQKEENRAATAELRFSKTVLSEGDLNGFVTLLGPGCETPADEAAVDRVLYVAQGAVTACTDLANTIVNTDQTFHVPENRSLTIRNHTDAPAKFLTLTLPAKRREEPVLVFPR